MVLSLYLGELGDPGNCKRKQTLSVWKTLCHDQLQDIQVLSPTGQEDEFISQMESQTQRGQGPFRSLKKECASQQNQACWAWDQGKDHPKLRP